MVKILAVDDSQLIVSVIRNFIKKEFSDAEVITGKNGEEAIEMYRKEKPDLVFMDIKMPGMDGLNAMQHILQEFSHAKVVMCTALKEPEEEAQAKEAGAVGYIKKPFSKEDIVSTIKDQLKL
ncbi:MAG: response regulator [Nanobdellota archaeon]